MFCPTSFTHMESQHLGPVGPPGGLVHGWAWRGCHRFLGAVAGDEGGKSGIWKERNLGGFSPRGLCPFHAMKGRKWGAQLPRAASPLKPPVFQVGESKEQEDTGKPPTAGLPHTSDCLRPWLRQRTFSFIQIIFFKLVRRRGCAFRIPSKDPPCSVRISFLLLHCPVWIRIQTWPGWTCQGPVPRQKLGALCCGECLPG